MIVALAFGCLALQAQQATCRALRGTHLAPEAIGLPTTGADVTSARHTHRHASSFCELRGRIHPVDPAADDIRFAVNLPEQWNGRAIHYGGSSFDGWLAPANGLKHTPVELRSEATPLERGFATFGSDSGHHRNYFPFPDSVNTLNPKFATNAEMQSNFDGDAIKKVHDVVTALFRLHYARPAEHVYFIGSSTGGREALRAAERYPADYDGVLAAYAAWDVTELDLQFIRTAQALYAPGGFLGRSQTRLIAHRVRQACDAADGLRDGLVSDPAGCHVEAASLRCADGRAHHGCLSEAQVHTVETYATPQRTDFPLSNGVATMPGYDILRGADFTGVEGLLHHPQRNPVILLNGFNYVIGDDVLRYFLGTGKHYDALRFNTATGDPGPTARPALPLAEWQKKLRQLAVATDSTDANLQPFFSRGGKLILVHGTADTVIPTDSSIAFYQRVQTTVGPAAADDSMRLYLVPGFGHGFGPFDAGFDTAGTLDAWVTSGAAPHGLAVTDNHRSHRTRPLCAWPSWPQYTGTGNPDRAESFRCAAPSSALPAPSPAVVGTP